MKKLILLLVFSISVQAFGKQVPSEITSVIVYQTRAEITRSASVNLEKGEHELVFEGISTHLDKNNIQVKGKGNLVILGIRYQKNYLNENELPEELQAIKEKMEELKIKSDRLKNQLQALDAERNLLQTNQRIGGNEENLTLEDLKSISAYYRIRTKEIADEKMDLHREMDKIEEEIRKLRLHYNDRTSRFQKNSGEIIVTVEASRPTKADLDVVYMVSSAGWTAEYDIRAEEIDEPLSLNYRAIITQNTGEDWNEVDLTLSTGDPSIRINKPELSTQYVDFFYGYKKNNYQQQRDRMQKSGAVNRAAAPMEMEDLVAEPDVSTMEMGKETKTMYTNYKVDRPYSLASGKKPLTVTIREQEVEAEYEYHAVPKLKNRVYLIAKAKNWGELVLLPGSMNIFFEGGYVGKTYLNPSTTEDELPISLGYDPGITVERELIQDLTSKRTMGTNKRETYGYEISVRNNKRLPITVKVFDQYPISKNSDIKIEPIDDFDGAKVDNVTGELTWELNIEPGDQVRKKFGYEVKYPKGKNIRGL